MLEGQLDDFTLPDILRLLAVTSKTGRLALRADAGAGRVVVEHGQVREATSDAGRIVVARRLLGAGLVRPEDLDGVLAGRSELPTDRELCSALVAAGMLDAATASEVLREHTVDAAFDLLRWRTGAFRFERVTPSGGDDLDLSIAVEQVLEEASSRLDAWPSVAERTGDGDAVVTIVRPKGAGGEVALPPDGWTLLSFVDGRRSVRELARLTGQGEFRTRRTLVALLDEGVVSVGDADGPGHVERLLHGHERLLALESRLAGAPATTPTVTPTTSGAPSAPTSRAMPSSPDPEPPSRPRPAAKADRARPGPVTVRDGEGAAASRAIDDVGTDAPAAAPRQGRLRTDPTVDADLVRRLIDGVESL